MYFSERDVRWMRLALKQASISNSFNEVPVGAVITDGTQLLSQAGNKPITTVDPTSHAEINAIRLAAQKCDNYRLTGMTMYVTLEPCVMCMGALLHARIERLVFGAFDQKSGAAVSTYQIGCDKRLNHQMIVEGGLLADECSEILRTFFKNRR